MSSLPPADDAPLEGSSDAAPVATLDAAPDERTLAGRMGRAAAWGAATSVVLRIGGFVSALLAARLLTPADFGVFAVALTVQQVVLNISSLGVTAPIVREPDAGAVARMAPTVAGIAIANSALLAGGVALLAPVLARVLGEPSATGPLRVMAIAIALSGGCAVPTALLAREFRQDRTLVAEAIRLVITMAVLVAVGLAGGGAFALAWSNVAGQLVFTAVLVALAPARHRPALDRAEARPLLRFGLPLAAANLLAFTVYNVDYVVVGRAMGSDELGYYLLAFTVASLPSTVFNAMVNSIAMPAFARVRHQRELLPAYTVSIVRVIAAVSFVACALLVALAEPALVAVYGHAWAPAAPALAVLGGFAACRVLLELFANVVVALGAPRRLLAIQGAWLLALVPAMVAGVELDGIAGAGWAHLGVAGLLVLPLYLVTVRGTTGTPLGHLVRSVLPFVVGATGAATVSTLVSSALEGAWPRLLAGTGAGLAVYAVVAGRSAVDAVGAARRQWGDAGA